MNHFFNKLSIQQMCITAIMTAILCILGPITIPIGPIPLSLTSFLLFIALYLLKTKLGTISYLLYFLLGIIGLPVFSGFSGGIFKLAGPTGGYLIGFIFTSLIAGLFIEKSNGNMFFSILGMTIGTFTSYILGTFWFILQMNCSIGYACSVCILPFLPADAIKIFLAARIGITLQHRLKRSHLLH